MVVLVTKSVVYSSLVETSCWVTVMRICSDNNQRGLGISMATIYRFCLIEGRAEARD